MNLYNIYYIDTLKNPNDEVQTYWRSSYDTEEAVRYEIETAHEWTVIFVERLK